MKKSTFLSTLIMTSLFALHLSAQSQADKDQAQPQTISIGSEEKVRLRIGGGFALSSTANRLKSQFTSYGFGDKFNDTFDWLYSGGNDYYPQSKVTYFISEVGLERKVSQQIWAGMSVGFDQKVSVKGYDRQGTRHSFLEGTYSVGQFLTMEHKSWFMSPQISFSEPSSKIGFYGGPTFEYHTLNVENDTQPTKHIKKTNIGAVLGLRAILADGLEWFANFRFSSGMPYGQVTNTYQEGDRTYTTVLPAGRINLNHFRTGLAWCIDW